MRYIIIYANEAFATFVYNDENYIAGMIVIDLYKHKITFDGKNWQDIEEDML